MHVDCIREVNPINGNPSFSGVILFQITDKLLYVKFSIFHIKNRFKKYLCRYIIYIQLKCKLEKCIICRRLVITSLLGSNTHKHHTFYTIQFNLVCHSSQNLRIDKSSLKTLMEMVNDIFSKVYDQNKGNHFIFVF